MENYNQRTHFYYSERVYSLEIFLIQKILSIYLMFNMCMIVHVQYVNTQTHCSSTNYHESIRKWPHICTSMYIHVSVRTNYIQVANYFNDIAINILLLSPSSSCYEPFTSEWLLIALIRAICMRRLHVHAEKSEECM